MSGYEVYQGQVAPVIAAGQAPASAICRSLIPSLARSDAAGFETVTNYSPQQRCRSRRRLAETVVATWRC